MGIVLPKAVREANERANSMIKDYAQQREGTPPEEVVAPESQAETVTSPEPVVETPVVTEPANPAVSETPVEDPNSETWKHRFEVMEGKLKAEVPALTEENRLIKQQNAFLMEQNQDLNRRVQALEASKPAEQTPSEITPPTPSEEFLSQPKIKEFKSEYPDIFEGTVLLCGQMILDAMGKVERKMGDRLAAKEKEVIQSKSDQFYEALAKAYPEWERIQSSVEFGQFMREVDELSGLPRWQLLKDASVKFDAPRAIRFFDLFFGKVASTAKTENPGNRITPRTERVDSRIAPPRASSATPKGGGDNGNQVSAAKAKEEYQKLCDQRIRKKISEADFKKEEARLHRIMRGP